MARVRSLKISVHIAKVKASCVRKRSLRFIFQREWLVVCKFRYKAKVMQLLVAV